MAYIPAVFRYFARRTIWAIGLFLVVTVVTYVIFFVIPVDPAKQACGQRATQTCIRLARHTLGLDSRSSSSTAASSGA